MKLLRILTLALAVSTLLCSCGTKPKAELTTIGYRADLTHDGGKEKIIVNIDGVEDGEAGVKIYTTVDDENPIIWKDSVGTAEGSQKGIYICKKSGNMDLLIWKPSEKDGKTVLEYAVFYLNYSLQTGKCTPAEEVSESIIFSAEDVKKGGAKYDEAHKFVKQLNKYISKSIALIDTVGGDLVYSKSSEESVNKEYTPDWYDKDYDATASTASSK